jgi:hypothetical protein
MRLSARKCKK